MTPLDKLEAALAAMTPGPWRLVRKGEIESEARDEYGRLPVVSGRDCAPVDTRAIAILRNVAAALIAEVRAGRATGTTREHSQPCHARRVLGDPTAGGVSIGPGGIADLGGRPPQPWRCFCGFEAYEAARAALDAAIEEALR